MENSRSCYGPYSFNHGDKSPPEVKTALGAANFLGELGLKVDDVKIGLLGPRLRDPSTSTEVLDEVLAGVEEATEAVLQEPPAWNTAQSTLDALAKNCLQYPLEKRDGQYGATLN